MFLPIPLRHILPLLFFLACTAASAQVFEVDTLLYNGNPDNRINLVIMGDGYQLSELDTFVRDCRNFVDRLFQTEPFRSYKTYLNVFAIKVPSNQSGANHPGTAGDEGGGGQPVMQVDNYFGSTFDYGGIHRLLSITRFDRAVLVLAANFPAYDQVFVLVNSSFYGGSGGAFATASTHSLSADIAIHELGHSFAGLADEYYAGDGYAQEKANMTRQTDPTAVKWRKWLDVAQVGIYQHCCGGNSAEWYKPHQNCKMEVLTNEFCPVCVEAAVERIHQLVQPVDGYLPAEPDVLENVFPRTFSLDLIKPEPNTLHVEWWLNGTMIGTDPDSVMVDRDDLLEGANRLTATIIDTTLLSRSELHLPTHNYRVEWIVQYSPKLTVVESGLHHLQLESRPNPSSGMVKLTYRLEHPSEVGLEVLNVKGQPVWSVPKRLQSAGSHQFRIDLTSQPDGAYFVQLMVDGVPLRQSVVKRD